MPTSRRLDWIIFGLRWLLVAGAIIVLVSETAPASKEAISPQALTFAIITVVGFNLIVAVMLLLRLPGTKRIMLAGDSLLAVIFFGVANGSSVILVGMGMFPIIIAALRYGRTPGMITAGLIAIFSLGLLVATNTLQMNGIPLLIGIIFLFLTAALTSLISVEMKDPAMRPLSNTEQEIEAGRLRAARERVRAMYEMSSTLGATLDYNKVLDAALDVGTFGLKELGKSVRMVGMVLLFRHDDHKVLHVITSRRLTRADEKMTVAGVRGVLGLALRQAEPVFGADAARDPELGHFVAFQECKSVLAIPLRANFENYGVVVYGTAQPDAFTDEHIELLTALSTQATIALQNAVLFQNVRAEKERIVEVEEDARKKLARDLHDGPTQVVSAIAMRVNYIRKMIEKQQTQTLMEELVKVEEMARNTTKEIRHMLFTLRPLVLETQGLTPALKQFAEKMKETHDLEVIIQSQPSVDALIDSHTQGVLFYVVEEAINNARKHAQAEHHWVRLYHRDNFFVTEIQDDGVGFETSALEAGKARNSLGMINMRERAQLVEGRLSVESTPGQGTKITVLVPLKEIPTQPMQPTSAASSSNGGTLLKEETASKRPVMRPGTSRSGSR